MNQSLKNPKSKVWVQKAGIQRQQKQRERAGANPRIKHYKHTKTKYGTNQRSSGTKAETWGTQGTQGKNHQRVNKPFLSTMLLLLLQYSYLADFDSSCWDRIQLSNRHGDEVPCKTWQEDVSHRWGPETVLLAGWDWLVRATKALR